MCKCKKDSLLPNHMTHNDFDLESDITEPINKFVAENCEVDKENINLDDIETKIEKLHKMPTEIGLYIDNKLK